MAGLVISGFACTRPDFPTPRPGSRILLFDPTAVAALEMTVDSPKSRARWNARFELGPSGRWLIQSQEIPSDADHHAHGALLTHWLDALSNLTLKEAFVQKQTPDRLGLVSPRMGVRLQTATGPFWIAIGTQAPTTDGSLAHFAQWTLAGAEKRTFQGTVQGAALQMLEHLSSITRMRATIWSPWERENITALMNRKGQALPIQKSKALEEALQIWTHLQVLRFLDHAQDIPKLPARPTHQLTLEVRDPRTGMPSVETYSVWRVGKQTFGRTSSRPAVIELYDKTISTLQTIASFAR